MARSELDLRIGASFTRYLTLRYQQQGRNQKNLISFGGCQTVTLGFVVARWLLRQRFIPEPFWYIHLTCLGIDPKWNRNRLFDSGTVSALHSLCSSAQEARVVEFSQQPKSKWRPLPLNTLEMTKLASTKLRIPSHQTMSIAETLYSKGLISYPRTETDSFSPSINLRELVALQAGNSEWGFFVSSRQFHFKAESS
jgi:DNA topoisomerase-3